MFKSSSFLKTVLSSTSLSARNSVIAPLANGEALAAVQVRKYAKIRKTSPKTLKKLSKFVDKVMAEDIYAKDDWIPVGKVPAERMPEEVLKKKAKSQLGEEEAVPYVGDEKLQGIPLNESMEELLREGVITKKHYTRMLKIDAFLNSLIDPGQIGLDLFSSPRKYKKELMKKMGKGEVQDVEQAQNVTEVIDEYTQEDDFDEFEKMMKKSKKSKKSKQTVQNVTPIPVTSKDDAEPAKKKDAEAPLKAHQDESPKQRALRKVLDEMNKQLGDIKAAESEKQVRQPAPKSKTTTSTKGAAPKVTPKTAQKVSVPTKKAKAATPAAPTKPSAKPAAPSKPTPAKPAASKVKKPSKKM